MYWQPKLLVQVIPEDLPDSDDDDDVSTVSGGISITDQNFSNFSDLPAFLYRRDPNTGVTTQHLIFERDPSYDIDVNYTDQQQWLLGQRQGDQYDRVREWIPNIDLADAEMDNVSDVNLLNEPLIWHGLPLLPSEPPMSNYERYIQYSMNELEE